MLKKKKNLKKRKIRQIKRKIKEIKKEKKVSEKNIILDSIENIRLQEFLQPDEISAPVLMKVETQKPLELNIASVPTSQTEKEETRRNYTATNAPKYSNEFMTNNEDEKKYENDFSPPVLSQSNSRGLRQEVLTSPEEIRRETNNAPRGIETSRIQQKRKGPFEVERERYREVEF